MTKIDHEKFLAWCEKHFEKVKCSGSQIQLNSVFCEDDKLKLYCNTEMNSFHCFKSERHGNLYKLVMEVERCDYRTARDILGSKSDIHNLDEKVAQLFQKKFKAEAKKDIKYAPLPSDTHLIDELDDGNEYKEKAIKYLSARKLKADNLFVCCSGKYQDRIIIPYYDKDDNLVYWNSRTLVNAHPKYLFPFSKDIGKGDLVYYPQKKDKKELYLCEGEFNAMVLNQCGLHSGSTGGKEVTEKQLKILRAYYEIIFCFDNDQSGIEATLKSARRLSKDKLTNSKIERKVSYVFPAGKYNDWNDMLMDTDETYVNKYIMENAVIFDELKFKLKFTC